jgi:hypothetical protein
MFKARAFLWAIVFGGCGSTPAPAPPPEPPTQQPSQQAQQAKPAPPPAATPAAPPGTTGRCRTLPDPAGDEDAPAAVAFCPDPMAMSRGDGIGKSDGPAPKPSIVPAWDLDALRDYACAYACAPAGATAHLLAWYTDEDDRPLRNDHALFVVERPAGDASPTWTVLVMYRHSWNKWWNISNSLHGRARPIATFDRRPTAAQIDAFLDRNGWSFTGSGGFTITAGNVIDELWPIATGSPAPRHFPAGIEQ